MRDIIIKLKKEGKSYKEICIETGLSKSTVSYYIGERTGKKYRREKNICKNCSLEISIKKTFCDKKCNSEYLTKKRTGNLHDGKLCTNKTIRKALYEKDGPNCSICETSNIWQGKPLTLHVDHINGNSDDNDINNLRLICPNCHSQLDTSKGAPRVRKETKRNKYLRKYKGYENAPVL